MPYMRRYERAQASAPDTLVRHERPAALRQRPELRGKCAGIMETGHVIGAGGSRPCCYFEWARRRRRRRRSDPRRPTAQDGPLPLPRSAVASDQIGYLAPGEGPGVTAAMPDISARSSCSPPAPPSLSSSPGMRKPQECHRKRAGARPAPGNLRPLKA